MSRRLTPYLFAGLLGVVSGVYIFKPLFPETVAAQEPRGATEAVKSPNRPQTDTVPQGGK